jgi:hypothetical protein
MEQSAEENTFTSLARNAYVNNADGTNDEDIYFYERIRQLRLNLMMLKIKQQKTSNCENSMALSSAEKNEIINHNMNI